MKEYDYTFLVTWQMLHALGLKRDFSAARERVKTVDGEWIRDGVYTTMDVPCRFRLVLRKYG